METIEEQSQSKCEMTLSAPLSARICLVGETHKIAETLQAAESFGLPVILSDNGLDMISDNEWRTYFIVNEFDGAIYEALHKAKQCILGPPALNYTAVMKYSLGHNSRPIYNYSMRGVVTCFTGIRKKDELTKLVNLIHSMGGCIKKDLNTKTTHLICNQSGGEKYQYAKTFRLTVVRPDWVYAAWEQRNTAEFCATTENFTKEHKLKAFEGQKICFFGFPAEEHQHMIDVLLENGGVPAELDDPECSHVVMPNAGAFFQSNTIPTNHINQAYKPSTNTPVKQPNESANEHSMEANGDIESVTVAAAAAVNTLENAEQILKPNTNSYKKNLLDAKDTKDNNDDDDGDDDDDICLHFDERLVVNYYEKSAEADEELPDSDEDMTQITIKRLNYIQKQDASTPKNIKHKIKNCTPIKTPQIDGIVLSKQTEHEFQVTNNISPIPIPKPAIIHTIVECDAEAEEEEDQENEGARNSNGNVKTNDGDELNAYDLKRKRDSFDNVSLMSIESFAQPTSTKKPKLIRTGSLKRTLTRSMSFVADHTPILKTFRTRRSSVCTAETSFAASEANDSMCSFASINTTLNESIRKPVKEKLRNICSRVTRSSAKRDKLNLELEKTRNLEKEELNGAGDFKTPKAPLHKPSAAANNCTISSNSNSNSNSNNNNSNNSSRNGNINNQMKTRKTNKRLFSIMNTQNTAIKSIPNIIVTNNNNEIIANEADAMKTQHLAADTYSPACDTSLQVIQKTNAEHIELMDNAPLTPKCKSLISTVVDEHTTLTKPEPKNFHTHILKSDWFWYTIQNGFANEMDYLFGDYLDSIANTPNTDRRDSLPISFNKRKRKRLSQRLQFEGTPLSSGKRRSSVSDAGLLSSVSNSFFDCTASPDKLECEKLHHAETDQICEATTPSKKSMRFNHFMDFYTTESNYVGILDTILNLFKNKLEELAETNDPLLNKSEIKSIFGNFLPIHEVHQSMLEHLRTLNSNWREDCLIGDIIIQHRDDLIKAYPPYVNFYEQMKEELQYCDKEYPRFHAFLKINQTKPECGRQSLQDLMIRPVQRLPSISLLLNDILKHTNTNSPDYVRLEEALKSIKEVTMHINEDKRRTESRMAIFDIFNDIEGCPAHLVSSNRSFISKCEVNELSDCLSGRGDTLMLYLFSDSIEVCKKRSRGFNSAKSPSTTKTHKHVKLISLNTIRIVIDIADSPRAFSLLQRSEKEKLYTFSITDEETDKLLYLKKLCLQMAEHACRTDADKMLVSRTSQELDVDISDVNLSTLSKAFKLAAKTRLKVGRAFSFNKTPNKLKRAVSTMMTSPFGSTNSLTPATQLAQMRLASCTNIHEAVDEDATSMRSSSPSSQTEMLVVPPMSVQPTRKSKAVVGRM